MSAANLKSVAEQVVRRAQRQGYVVPREVREELTRAGASDDLWKDVVALARPSLTLRRGRYYFSAPVSDRVRQEQSQQLGVQRAVNQLLNPGAPQGAALVERRGGDRADFVQTVTVRGEDGAECTLLSRDLSATGIRLVGARRLLGQKVHVFVPRPGGEPPYDFLVRILWTCAVGDGLHENGGSFLEVKVGQSLRE
jgi:hypothetical protein